MVVRPGGAASFLVVFMVSLIDCAPALAQGPSQPAAGLSRLEISATVPFKRTSTGAGAEPAWSGPGASIAVNGNVSDRLAMAAEAETYFHHAVTALVGAQASTGFFYGSNRDPVPGRFFARALVGAVAVGTAEARAALQVGGGADVLLSRTRGVGLRWDVGYEIVRGETHRPSGRIAIGLIFGPHLLH
ncbi:MAG TPA: hypothetical protein VLT86_13585 [Vicinamibacterales bacterium]|nr:hypothetical protein [Vicinamibacterales bacterium]